MEVLTSLKAQISNAAQAVFLVMMIAFALIRLTDGKREIIIERIALFLISIGAFFQLVQAAHPAGTSFEVLITHAGMAMWMLSQYYNYYYKKQRNEQSRH